MAEKWKMIAAVLAMVMACGEAASAADSPKPLAHEDQSVAERIGEAVENVGKTIEQAVTGVVKNVEEQRVGERLYTTIKSAATKTGEELAHVGKKIEEKFSKWREPLSALAHDFLRNPKKAPAVPAPAAGK